MHFIPKKYLILVFYDNRNLKISKSKKSERYFRDKIEIFIRLSDEHFARHFESYWRETWRHTGRRTVQISLETPPPPPPATNLFSYATQFRFSLILKLYRQFVVQLLVST